MDPFKNGETSSHRYVSLPGQALAGDFQNPTGRDLHHPDAFFFFEGETEGETL